MINTYSIIITSSGKLIDYFNEIPGITSNTAYTGLILGLRPANERRRYFVTASLIGWAQA